MSAIVVIPARLQSSRLPRKILAEIGGKPLVQRIYESVQKSSQAEEIYLAIDSEETAAVLDKIGAEYIMTEPDLPSGTARIASLMDKLPYEYIVNVQGDMPYIQTELLDNIIKELNKDQADVVTPVWPLTETKELQDSNVVKVVRDPQGWAHYFSRSPVPFVRDAEIEMWTQKFRFWGHYGIYAYRRKVLEDIAAGRIPASPLEEAEKLEQLGFLDAGYTIKTIETEYREISVNTSEELESVRGIFEKGGFGI